LKVTRVAFVNRLLEMVEPSKKKSDYQLKALIKGGKAKNRKSQNKKRIKEGIETVFIFIFLGIQRNTKSGYLGF